MNKDDFDFVSAHDLRMGLFVDLELGWIDHPFASSRFKISNERQLQTLKGLNIESFRYIPSKSDFFNAPLAQSQQRVEASLADQQHAMERALKAQQLRQQHDHAHAAQQESLTVCERRFTESALQYRKTMDLLHSKPADAATLSRGLVRSLVVDILQPGDTAIRLLTEAAGDKTSMHPVNVTVISLLLGRALGLQDTELQELGLAALLHDIGKLELPERLHRSEESFSTTERNAYQSHVAQSVRMVQTMGLSNATIQTIAQHHELADGSGFPHHLKQGAMGMGARILALVNRYDGMCNPAKPRIAMTPHEALAMIFSQQRARFDATVLSAFIRMIGVYPPGSVVQLNDERHAIVVSVNAARPLKPRVIVHEPGTPRHQALILDLENVPHASIRRSLKPDSLSAAAHDYLQPRQRMCYFFEPVDNAANAATLAASA